VFFCDIWFVVLAAGASRFQVTERINAINASSRLGIGRPNTVARQPSKAGAHTQGEVDRAGAVWVRVRKPRHSRYRTVISEAKTTLLVVCANTAPPVIPLRTPPTN
jgi:hypothetical protein